MIIVANSVNSEYGNVKIKIFKSNSFKQKTSDTRPQEYGQRSISGEENQPHNNSDVAEETESYLKNKSFYTEERPPRAKNGRNSPQIIPKISISSRQLSPCKNPDVKFQENTEARNRINSSPLLRKTNSQAPRLPELQIPKPSLHQQDSSSEDQLKTPLPTSTCSKRLHYAKSTLLCPKSSDNVEMNPTTYRVSY